MADELYRQDSGLERQKTLVRVGSVPKRPCATCTWFNHDKGQAFFDQEGLGQVPEEEGGFLKPGKVQLSAGRGRASIRPEGGFPADGAGGPFDSTAYGWCELAGRRRRGSAQLTHQFQTCGGWEETIRSR